METQNEHNPFGYLGICINIGKEQLMCVLQIDLQGFVGPKVYVGIFLFADNVAAEMGGVVGLMQPRDRTVSNKSCGFYPERMIWGLFSPLRCLFFFSC